MKKSAISLLDAPREFRLNELFFSCTDRRGVIEAGNDVFTRVSAYAEAEMLGQPHNMIRHPDMPRAIFKLFWRQLLAGQPIAAYIKNLAQDGRYYWVLALATPLATGGFISVRFKPSSSLFPQIEALYREMRASELASEARGETCLLASTGILAAALHAQGFESYDAFMRTALLREELNSRDATLVREHRELWPAAVPAAGEKSLVVSLGEAYAGGRKTYAALNVLYGRLDDFACLNEALKKRSQQIFHLTADFGLIAFNVALKASRLGHEGRSIDVIARNLGDSANQIGVIVRKLDERATRITERLGEVIFNLAWARLQFEMTALYYHEVQGRLIAGTLTPAHASTGLRLQAMAKLQTAFSSTGERAIGALRALAVELAGLDENAEALRRIIMLLHVAQVSGQVEASRLRDDEAFAATFMEVRAHVESTARELTELNEVAAQLGALVAQAPVFAKAVAAADERLVADGRSFADAREPVPAAA